MSASTANASLAATYWPERTTPQSSQQHTFKQVLFVCRQQESVVFTCRRGDLAATMASSKSARPRASLFMGPRFSAKAHMTIKARAASDNEVPSSTCMLSSLPQDERDVPAATMSLSMSSGDVTTSLLTSRNVSKFTCSTASPCYSRTSASRL